MQKTYLSVFLSHFFYFPFGSLGNAAGSLNEKPLSTVVSDVKDGKVKVIEVEEGKLSIEYKNGDKATSRKEPQESMLKLLENSGADPKSVEVKVKDLSSTQLWLGILSNILPLILTVAFFFLSSARPVAPRTASFFRTE